MVPRHAWLRHLICSLGWAASPLTSRPRYHQPQLEALEARQVPVTFTVNSAGDQPDPTPFNNIQNDCDPLTPGNQFTLRGAIQTANSNVNVGGPDDILFDILDGLVTILPTSALSTVSDPVIVDGTPPAGKASQVIQLDGTNAPLIANGLTITAGSSTVRGLVIIRFNHGIELKTAGGNKVEGNYIGTNTKSALGFGNRGHGVFINGTANNVIGGAASSARNVISNNKVDGVRIAATGATGNVLQSNYIGVTADGDFALGNGGHGVTIQGPGGSGNTIGVAKDGAGQPVGKGNTISGNGGSGVNIFASSNNVVAGNLIGVSSGTGAQATLVLGNKQMGVSINQGAMNNTIGGTTPEERNTISGNMQHGIEILGATTTSNIVIGNHIGINQTGDEKFDNKGKPTGNEINGVLINDSPSNTIGGTTEAKRNVISGNLKSGIEIKGGNAKANQVIGNYVGLAADGVEELGNFQHGVLLSGGDSNIIGGPGSSTKLNLIAGNGFPDENEIDVGWGIKILPAATNTTIQKSGINQNKDGKSVRNAEGGILNQGEGTVVSGQY